MKDNKIFKFGIIVSILIAYVASTYGDIINLKIDFIPHSFGLHTILFLSSIIANEKATIAFTRDFIPFRL